MRIVLILFNFCFVYRVVNEPLESISSDLGFTGNTLAEGITYFHCILLLRLRMVTD